MFTKIDALVIKQFDIGEGDKLLTLLTKEGKITASAKGVKSIKSKNLAATGLFCFSRFSLGGKNGRYYVSQAELIESFYELRNSMEKIALACYFAEICLFVSKENMESEDLLSLMLNSLYMLTKKDKDLSYIKPVFELRTLSICGYTPNLVCCEHCAKFEGDMFFDIRGGVMICGDCREKTNRAGRYLLTPSSVISAMRYIIYSKPKEIFSFELAKENREILQEICENYLLVQLDHNFSTLEFYHSVE